jgi:hypothetical protein
LHIRQTWTRIVVELQSDQSSSQSETASIFVDKGVNPKLVYTYMNEPNPDQLKAMEKHSGTTLLELLSNSDGLHLNGHYYSGRGRGTYGEMQLKRSNDAK